MGEIMRDMQRWEVSTTMKVTRGANRSLLKVCYLYFFCQLQEDTLVEGKKWIKGALIGAGSYGKVYLGMDAANGLLMAVKQVELPIDSVPNEERNKSMLKALELEIDLLKDLQHENIVQYLCTLTAFALSIMTADLLCRLFFRR